MLAGSPMQDQNYHKDKGVLCREVRASINRQACNYRAEMAYRHTSRSKYI